MTNVDPSDLTLWPTIRHLFPLWRAQYRLVSVGLACALVFTLFSLLIPILAVMAVNTWDAIDVLKPLLTERRIVDAARLTDPSVELTAL